MRLKTGIARRKMRRQGVIADHGLTVPPDTSPVTGPVLGPRPKGRCEGMKSDRAGRVDIPAEAFAASRPDLQLCDIGGDAEEPVPTLRPADGPAVVTDLPAKILARSGRGQISVGLIPMVEHCCKTLVAFERVAR